MRTLGKFSVAWNVIVLCLLGYGDCSLFSSSHMRTDEVTKHCSSVISSAIELANDVNIDAIKKELSFVNGGWRQDGRDHPILPSFLDAGNSGDFPEIRDAGNSSDFPEIRDYILFRKEPLKLASFWITYVNHDHKIKNSVSVNGILGLGFSGSISERWGMHNESRSFVFNQDESILYIKFEGIYVKSDANGGERVLCLLGRTDLPSRESNSNAPWEWAKNFKFYGSSPPVTKDDHIRLTLHYPVTFSLKSRIILGKMESFNKVSSSQYFDDVEISSSLSKMEAYQFGSKDSISKACDPHEENDEFIDGAGDVYKGEEFCKFFSVFENHAGSFSFLPNWKCNRSSEYCAKLGPFGAHTSNGTFAKFEMRMSNVLCNYDDSTTAKVSAVFKAYEVLQNDYYFTSTSVMDNMTLVAEGTWSSNRGQLCMIGCVFEGKNAECNAGIRLYFLQTLSLTHMAPFIGAISSLQDSNAAFYPLSFQQYAGQYERFSNDEAIKSTSLRYSYTKMKDACTLLDRYEPSNYQTIIKKAILNYPKIESEPLYNARASYLVEDLSLHSNKLEFRIFSIGPFLMWSQVDSSHNISSQVCGSRLLANVSAYITSNGPYHSNFGFINAEGVYDSDSGKMFLVGCKQANATYDLLHESMDLDRGMDCSIEIQVSYPPLTSRWLVDPTAKVSISSKRNDDDPLHFDEISEKNVPIYYRKQKEDILSAKSVEAMLEIATLVFAVVCLVGQFVYIKKHPNVAPFMSLVMLGIQAIGHCFPLITGAQSLFKKGSTETFSFYGISQWMHLYEYAAKILNLASFSLSVMLFQKVRKSRTRSSNTQLLPSDRLILYITVAVHVIGYAIVFASRSDNKADGFQPDGVISKWENEITAYFGVAQDFFLLPQMIGNLVWLHCSDKPLSGLYYIGTTVVRILPHLYDYVKSPVPFPSEFADPQMDFFTKFGDVIISVGALVFAGAVFLQQRWGLLSFSPRRYERLPVKPSENELANVH